MKKKREETTAEKLVKKLSPKQLQNLKDWVKRIYSEIDDDETPDIVMDELYHIAHGQAREDLHNELWPLMKQRKELLKYDISQIKNIVLESEKVEKLDRKIGLALMNGDL